MPDAVPLPCCLHLPDAFRAKARYAVAMLLAPLGRTPAWTDHAGLAGGGLFYGPAAEAPAADGVVTVPLAPDAPAFFAGDDAYDPERVAWMPFDGVRRPLLFGTPQAPDLVASAFFWLSGWQEHTTPTRDTHGRFPYDASLQARWGTALWPAVDAYREILAERLRAAGHDVAPRGWHGHAWAVCPTHDIDYLNKWRPGILFREGAHYLLRNDRREALPRRLARFGRVVADWLTPGDPCRTAFERMHAEVAARGGHATYFVKTGAGDPHDVAYRPDHPYLRRRVDALQADGFEVGLHPSYQAHTDADRLRAERDRLAALTGVPPVSVRQHYLRYHTPTTARLHEALGFRLDSTLGFARHEGFRHATCHPFRLYDLAADRPLDVWELPLAVMESALFNRRGLSAEAACAATDAVLAVVRRFGGVCVLLWHNTLWDEVDYPGWGAHFLHTLDAAQAAGGWITSMQRAAEAAGL